MTTLIFLKTNTAIFLAADSQVSQNNIRLPDAYPKIQLVAPNLLVAGTGSVGDLQQLSNRALDQIKINKILAKESSEEISPSQLAGTMADLSYNMNMEYKKYNPFAFLVAGNNTNNEPLGFSIDCGGSVLSLHSFYADGSGQQLAMGKLQQIFNPDMKDKEVTQHIYRIFQEVAALELYTDGMLEVYRINEKGVSRVYYEPLEIPEKPKEKGNK